MSQPTPNPWSTITAVMLGQQLVRVEPPKRPTGDFSFTDTAPCVPERRRCPAETRCERARRSRGRHGGMLTIDGTVTFERGGYCQLFIELRAPGARRNP